MDIRKNKVSISAGVPKLVRASDMCVGDIGVIAEGQHTGEIVYRVYDNRLISLTCAQYTWSWLSTPAPDFDIRVLSPGEVLTIVVGDK